MAMACAAAPSPRPSRATRWKRDLRFPVPRTGRKTSGSHNIKRDMKWYSGLTECEIDCDFPAGYDFRKLCFLSLYRHVAFAIENSPALIAPNGVHGKIMPGFYP